MMKVRLTRNTVVRHEAGTVLEVSDQEASRLFAFHLAVKAEDKPVEKAVKAPAETAEAKPAQKKRKTTKK